MRSVVSLDAPLPTPTMMHDDNSPATWSEDSLVQSSSNFLPVPRISALESLETVIAKICEHEQSGVPLIVEDWDKRPNWDFRRFSVEGFLEESEQLISARNFQTSTDTQMPLDGLINHYQQILKDDRLQENNLYGKDLPCPLSWEQWLREFLPEHCHPLGSNDMHSHLSPKERPETLMCYIGIGETFTPAHKDPCGSFGHNLMCYASEHGSAFWFMSETGCIDEDKPSGYFRTKLHTDLDLESRKLTVEEFRKASFTVYCAEQRLGDLVLVPPRSCHQVVNAGGITIKTSWSRMGLKSLEYSLHSELLFYHRVCRPEVYRVKLTVFRALQAYAQRLSKPYSDANLPSTTLKILDLFDSILVEEWTPTRISLPDLETSDSDSPFVYSCDFCGADIFQSFLACMNCCDSDRTNAYMCCPSCFVEGRSCQCGAEHMKPHQVIPFIDLVNERNKAAITLKRHIKQPIQLNWTSKMMGSSRIPIFAAACLYRKRVREHTYGKRGYARCELSRRPDSKHYLPQHWVLRCPPCHRGLCFAHTLEARNIHSAEILLVCQHGRDEWHKRHLYKPDKHGSPTNSARFYYYGEHSKRLVKASLLFQACRPLDSKRSKPGFYDKTVRILAEVSDDSNKLSLECQQPGNQAEALINDFRTESSITSTNINKFRGQSIDKKIAGDSSGCLTPLSDLEDDLPLTCLTSYRMKLLLSDPLPAAATLPLPLLNSQPSASPLERIPSPSHSNDYTVRPNPRKRVFVDVPRFSSTHSQSSWKRQRPHVVSSGSIDQPISAVSSANSTPFNIRTTKHNTVVPLSTYSSLADPSRFSTSHSLSSRIERLKNHTPVKVGPPVKGSKRKQITTNALISATPRSSVYPRRFGVPSLRASNNTAALHNRIQPSVKRPPAPLEEQRHTSNTPPGTPAPPVVSPEQPQHPAKNTTNSSKIESLYQETIQMLHPGDSLRHSKMIADYKSADDPGLFLVLQVKELAGEVKRSNQERDMLRAEATAARLQMSYMTRKQPDAGSEQELVAECQRVKENQLATRDENEELKNRLQFLERIVNGERNGNAQRTGRDYSHPHFHPSHAGRSWHNDQSQCVDDGHNHDHNHDHNVPKAPDAPSCYQLTPPDSTQGSSTWGPGSSWSRDVDAVGLGSVGEWGSIEDQEYRY